MAHTLDTSQRFAASTATTVVNNYTCGAGTTVLVIGLSIRQNTARTGTPTYNGVNMTQGDQTRLGASEVSCEIWYLINPPTGVSYQISVPNGTGVQIAVTAVSFKAATGFGTQYDVGNGNATSTASPSQAVTTTVNGAAVFQIACHSSNTLGSPLSFSHTAIGTATDHGQYVDAAQYALQANLGTITLTVTNLGASAAQATSVVAFKEYSLSNIKTIQGVTRANVKTVQGLSIASMKNFGGLA